MLALMQWANGEQGHNRHNRHRRRQRLHSPEDLGNHPGKLPHVSKSFHARYVEPDTLLIGE